MKKLLILVMLMFFVTGCQVESSNEDITDQLYKEYKNYINSLETNTSFESQTDIFDTKVILNATNKGNYRYDIIIDNPKIEMYNIKVVACIEDGKNAVYPTLGLLETTTFSMIPGVVDKENNIYKGVNLSGVSSTRKATIKFYLTYTNSKEDSTIQERYIQV